MSLLAFNESMKLNIQSIDSQHQQWIELINKFNEAIQKRQNKAVLYQALDDMLDYTRAHFAHEELLLFMNGYPDYSHHKELHDDFVEKLKRLEIIIERVQNNNWKLILKVIELMSSWLSDHIQKTDRQYALFLKEKGVN